MEQKILYKFTLDRESEKVVESVRKNKKTGEETITKRKKVVKEPVEVQIRRPNRRQLEEAELEYSVEMSNCIKKGILTKAMLGKKYSDTGGLFSEDDSNQYGDLYKEALDLQNEYLRLDTVKKRTETQNNRFEKVKGLIATNRKTIVDFESNFQSLFDHTADVKAQNKVLLWYCLNLTFIYDGELDKFVPYFVGETFEDKTSYYYDLEEEEDDFYNELIKKASTTLAFWFFNQASSQEEFEKLMSEMEIGSEEEEEEAEEEKSKTKA